jgi:hypothetical protein
MYREEIEYELSMLLEEAEALMDGIKQGEGDLSVLVRDDCLQKLAEVYDALQERLDEMQAEED